MLKRDERSGLMAFIKAHRSSESVQEAAEKLGIDATKYKRRMSVWNVSLKKKGYKPLEPHQGRLNRTDAVLAQLESEGLIEKVKTKSKDNKELFKTFKVEAASKRKAPQSEMFDGGSWD